MAAPAAVTAAVPSMRRRLTEVTNNPLGVDLADPVKVWERATNDQVESEHDSYW
jgi:hypothetical protein